MLVEFGSTARGAERPRDLDLALLSGDGWLSERPEDLWARWSQALGRGDLDLVWLPNAGWLLCQQVATRGRLVFESRPGQFRRFQIASHLRSVDAGVWRRRSRRYVEERLRGSLTVQTDLIQQKLGSLVQYLANLEGYLVPPDAWAGSSFQYASERMLELLVEAAASINTEVAQSQANIPPSDYYSSFFSMAQTGWISRELAGRLAPLTRIRNVLVHHYEELDAGTLQETLKGSLADWKDYAGAIQARLSAT